MHDDTPEGRPDPPKPEPIRAPTEAELSRIAREAVHQPPDARLDKQLARMGLIDAPDATEPQPAQPANRQMAIDPELERLRDEVRRTRMALWMLAGVTAILAVVIVVLLFR